MLTTVTGRFFTGLQARIRGPLTPLQADEDNHRQRVLLYAVLFLSTLLATVCSALTILGSLRLGEAYRGVPWWSTVLVLLCFLGLLELTRRGYFRLVSSCLFVVYLTPSLYASARWGIDLPQALLLDAFLIVMTSVLFGTLPALVLSAGLSLSLFVFSWLGTAGILPVNRYWHDEIFTLWDGISITATLLCIALLCRLANHEIERSLKRARESERLLRLERDLLEIRVQERTQALHQAQLEKLTQLHRFVEFGRLAVGFFHDLASPLNALTLNLELMQGADMKESKAAYVYLQRAVAVTERLESFLKDVQRHIKEDSAQTTFSASDMIQSVLSTVDYQAKKAQVSLRYEGPTAAMVFGNPIKFYKLIANLVVNAIDAYANKPTTNQERVVLIRLSETKTETRLEIIDSGCGMSADQVTKIWEPFYTTKAVEGMGIGLSIVKRTVEEDFGGTISCVSVLGQGTTFTVIIPHHDPGQT